jgi:hypothetical protein
VPKGGGLAITGDGGAVVFGVAATLLAVIPAPWAKDAHGRHIATHYEVHGTTLIQFVGHQAPGTAYPVVADPTWQWTNADYGVRLTHKETHTWQQRAASREHVSGCQKSRAGAQLSVVLFGVPTYLHRQTLLIMRSPKNAYSLG